MIFGFKFTYDMEQEVISLSDAMESNLRDNAYYYDIVSKTRGKNQAVTYRKQLSKPIIDEIDKVLARHYGFTEEELDFIINYDIKYRMGDGLNNENE